MPHKDPEQYKSYSNNYMKNRWTKRRKAAVEYLGGECVICGVKEDLEFDHIDPSTKICSIGKASSFSEQRFWAEVDKCQLLCKEHHLMKSRTNGELNRYKTPL